MGCIILLILAGMAVWYFYADEIKEAWEEVKNS